MDRVHGPPLIFKRKSPLSILYENLPKVRVWKTQTLIYCLHSWGFVSYKCLVLGSRPYEWEDHKLVLRYRRSSEFLPPIFSFQHFQIAIRSGRHPPPCLLYSIAHKNKLIYFINKVYLRTQIYNEGILMKKYESVFFIPWPRVNFHINRGDFLLKIAVIGVEPAVNYSFV